MKKALKVLHPVYKKTFEKLSTSAYAYELDEKQIASEPLTKRDQSRLLQFRNGLISHHRFDELAECLAPGSAIVFNDTRVIPARIHFKKESGALIEVFCLSPADGQNPEIAMTEKGQSDWEVMIGNRKRWKEGDILKLKTEDFLVKATRRVQKGKDIVCFEWEPGKLSFSEVLQRIGKMPLPPYIKRAAKASDRENYQTVFAGSEGAVAAPTASLHFTEDVLIKLKAKNIQSAFLSLHVGAGTFKPVQTDSPLMHEMHTEKLRISKKLIKFLIDHQENLVCSGTTSLRAVESIYWFGLQVMQSKKAARFQVEALEAYHYDPESLPATEVVLREILNYMQQNELDFIDGETGIFILPGYPFRLCKGLITNFHLPSSTLLMLIAAFCGNDWKNIYEEAKKANYRFLSYGDASLLWRI